MFCMSNNFPLIYLDNASTTIVDSRVLEEMLPYFTEIYGNASSNHKFGKMAKVAIEKSRKQVASLINSNESEIIYTSGATESINFALKGFIEANIDRGNHIITVKTEHKAVLATCEYLETKGVEVTYLDVDKDGLISLQDLKDAIRDDTVLICVMYVNNETGVIQPIKEIGQIAAENDIIFFCDATQAIGKIQVDVEENSIDMLCFSGHKLNGPKGVGVLYKKRNIELTPLIHGGGQENDLRGGTYNTPLIVGLGKAAEISISEYDNNYSKIKAISNYAYSKLQQLEGVSIIGNQSFKIGNILNVYIPNISADIFVSKTNEVALSNGSACNSQIIENSHVLKAMGINNKDSNHYVRFSIDKYNTIEHVDEVLKIINAEIISNA